MRHGRGSASLWCRRHTFTTSTVPAYGQFPSVESPNRKERFLGLRFDDDGRGMGHGNRAQNGEPATEMTKLMQMCASEDYTKVSNDKVCVKSTRSRLIPHAHPSTTHTPPLHTTPVHTLAST